MSAVLMLKMLLKTSDLGQVCVYRDCFVCMGRSFANKVYLVSRGLFVLYLYMVGTCGCLLEKCKTCGFTEKLDFLALECLEVQPKQMEVLYLRG